MVHTFEVIFDILFLKFPSSVVSPYYFLEQPSLSVPSSSSASRSPEKMGLKIAPTRNPRSNTTGNRNQPHDVDPDLGLPEQTDESSSNSSENVAEKEINVDEDVVLPLEVGTHVYCSGRNDTYFPAKIIERRKLADGEPTDYEYYVHYTQFDRRLDEWVKLEKIDLTSVETKVEENIHIKEAGLVTRRQRRQLDGKHAEGHEGFDAAFLREHEEATKVKNIASIELGRYEIEAWYFSPFPPEYNDSSKLYFCDFCLNFLKRKDQLERHLKRCSLKHPPGNEIYRSGILSMFEVDGRLNRVYSENLCYLAKLFLDHKALVVDVSAFLFYILCECDDRGCHIVAYFSKEKHSDQSYNLSCILTLPPYQKKGYGKFLIAFSYELSKMEGKTGTPEKPLSDLGRLSYLGYWTRVLLKILKELHCNISIEELSSMTSIHIDDVLFTLKHLDIIKYRRGQKVIVADPKILDRHLKAAGPGGLEVDVSELQWTPFVESLK